MMITRALNRFRRSQDGASTVETVLWIPVFFVFFALLFEISMVFNGQARTLRIVQEANRDYSVGQITSEADLGLRIKNNLATMNVTATAIVPRQTAGVITTRVDIPVAEFGSLGWFSAFKELRVRVTAEQTVENMEI